MDEVQKAQQDTGCVSTEVLHPTEDPAFVVFEGESFRETFEGSVSYCYCHFVIFSLSFFFIGRAKNLGICEAAKESSGASSKNREKKEHLEEPLDRDSLQKLLWRMQTLNWDTATALLLEVKGENPYLLNHRVCTTIIQQGAPQHRKRLSCEALV